MEPITMAFLAAGAVKLIGGLIGAYGEQEGMQRAQDILEEAKARGDVSPAGLEAAARQTLGSSAFESIRRNPEYAQAGAETLGQLNRTVASGGMTLADKANLNETLGESSRQEAMSRAAGEAELQRRGALNSGAALALQMGAQQRQANTNAAASLRAAGDASLRAYQANMARGQFANQLDQTDYQRQRDRASAQDENARLQWGRNYQAARDVYVAKVGNAERQGQYASALANTAMGKAQAFGRTARDAGNAVGDGIAGGATYFAGQNKPNDEDD